MVAFFPGLATLTDKEQIEFDYRPTMSAEARAALTSLQKQKRNKSLIEMLKYISPVAWININMYGFYFFGEQTAQIDIMKLTESINMPKSA